MRIVFSVWLKEFWFIFPLESDSSGVFKIKEPEERRKLFLGLSSFSFISVEFIFRTLGWSIRRVLPSNPLPTWLTFDRLVLEWLSLSISIVMLWNLLGDYSLWEIFLGENLSFFLDNFWWLLWCVLFENSFQLDI